MPRSLLDDLDVREMYLGELRIGSPRHVAAKRVGLTHSQVKRYAATHSDFQDAILDAVGEGVDPLYAKAYELALGVPCNCGGGHTEVDVGRQGNAGKAVSVHSEGCRYMPPDPSMLTFMLKALQPDTFGSKVSIEVEHKVDLGSAKELLELEERLRRRQQELGGGQAFIQLAAESIRELPA